MDDIDDIMAADDLNKMLNHSGSKTKDLTDAVKFVNAFVSVVGNDSKTWVADKVFGQLTNLGMPRTTLTRFLKKFYPGTDTASLWNLMEEVDDSVQDAVDEVDVVDAVEGASFEEGGAGDEVDSHLGDEVGLAMDAGADEDDVDSGEPASKRAKVSASDLEGGG